MDPSCDVVEQLLQTTGLSCDDLLAKLQKYRLNKSNVPEETTTSKCESEKLDTLSENQCSEKNGIETCTKLENSKSLDDDKSHDNEKIETATVRKSENKETNKTIIEKLMEKLNDSVTCQSDDTYHNVGTAVSNSGLLRIEDKCAEDNKNGEQHDEKSNDSKCITTNAQTGEEKLTTEVPSEPRWITVKSFAKDNTGSSQPSSSLCNTTIDKKETKIITVTKTANGGCRKKMRKIILVKPVGLSEKTNVFSMLISREEKEKLVESSKELHNSKTGGSLTKAVPNIEPLAVSGEVTNSENNTVNDGPHSLSKEVNEEPDPMCKEVTNSRSDFADKISDQKPSLVNKEAITSESDATKEVYNKKILLVNKEITSGEKVAPKDATDVVPNDHNYSTGTELNHATSISTDKEEREMPLNTEDLPKSEDIIRNSIRMQLSSLRNMKKSSGYLPELKTKSLFFHNLKKKRKSSDVNSDNDKDASKNDKEVINLNENSLVSLSDETNFVILDVSGGVDRLKPAEEAEDKGNFSKITTNEDCTTAPNQDKNKVLRVYKKKKLAFPQFDSRHDNLSNQEIPSVSIKNISENFNQDPGIKKSVKNSEKSPFISDSLEDFLNESAELRISYSIPKLGAEEGIGESTKQSPFDNVVSRTRKIDPEVVQKEKPKLVKAKTLAEMRRQFEKLKAKEQGINLPPRGKKSKIFQESRGVVEQVEDKIVHENTLPRNSFIIFNKKKLWLTSNYKDRCFGVVRSTTHQEEIKEVTPKKRSLLSSLSQSRPSRVTYKPGPLSKKASLQNADSRWTTEVKTLPKIFLEVTPETHKPINPQVLHLLPTFDDPVVTEERAKFALSVLKPKDTNVQTEAFTFHIPYRNKQEKVMVRKPCKIVEKLITPKNEHTDPQTDISNVINDIITYIEVKEMEDTLIKDDIIEEPTEKSVEINLKGKKKVKRKKLDLELRRLNCKVIDVATNETDNRHCTKPFCKLGCVCKSLLCESVFSDHCQLVECMFGCKCPPEKSAKLLCDKNSLSIQTVHDLEDKAKKNLARVEKEFTQTLIHTDDDAILVGTAKMRRSSKPPKKYTDYIGNDFFEDNELAITNEEMLRAKRSHVVLQKLDLDGIVPLCLYHRVYSCSCKGETIVFPPKKSVNLIPKIRIVKAKDDQNRTHDSCARIRKVFSQYKERNRSPIYKQKLQKNLGFSPIVIEGLSSTVTKSEPKKPSKRKQSFTIREDTSPLFSTGKEFALQRRKKKVKKFVEIYTPVFDGEIKLSLQDNKELLNVIGTENASLEYLRILPWSKLVKSFQTKKINIWSRQKKPTILFCNAAGYFPPKDFVDIRQINDRSDIINWILTDTLPPETDRNLMHLILTPKNAHFLIAGYCMKKMTETQVETDEDPLMISTNNSCGKFEEIYVESPEATDVETNYTFTELPTSTPDNGRINIQQSLLIKNLVQGKAKKLNILGHDTIKIPKALTIELVSQTDLNKLPLLVKENTQSDLTAATGATSFTAKKQGSPKKLGTTRSLKRQHSVLIPKSLDVDKGKESTKSSLLVKKRKYADLIKKLNESDLSTEKENSLKDDSQNESVKLMDLLDNTHNSEVDTSQDALTITDLLKDKSSKKTKEKTKKNKKQTGKSNKKIRQPSYSNKQPEKRKIDNSINNSDKNIDRGKKNTPEKTQETCNSLEIIPAFKNDKPSTLTSSKIQEKKSQKTRINSESEPSNDETPLEIAQVRDLIVSNQTKSPSSKPTNSKQSLEAKKNLTSSSTSSRTLKCTHKDMHNRNKTLLLTNKLFAKRVLHSNQSSKFNEVTVSLPRTSKNVKWRMIYLNSDFTYLTFGKGIYSVKYTDLMDVVKMSSNIKATIMLRNKEFCDYYKHPLYAIFCIPDYQDRLFIGPYLPTESHDLETFRYLQGRLIDTLVFNKMLGRNSSEKQPLWLYETNTRPISLPNGLVIDITDDDDVVQVDSDHEEQSNSLDHLLTPPFVEELTQEELKAKRNINRYVVTNIPHLGYFDAYQRDSKAIEVYWPNGSKGYRFSNVTFAKNLLTQYLSQIFCPVPQDFKINVIIMTNLGVQSNQLIDTKYFSQPGPFFCGEFGICDKESISEDLLKKCNVPSTDALLQAHKENQENEDAMIRIFGLYLMSNEELRKHAEPEEILKWALSEIYILKKLGDNYQSEKFDLQNMIRTHAQKIQKLKKLNKEKSSIEDPTETIEIEDSDEDNEENEVQPPVSMNTSTCEEEDTKAVLNSRSLLKTNLVIKPGYSLLKTSDNERLNFESSNTVKLKNKSAVVKNSVLITKIK